MMFPYGAGMHYDTDENFEHDLRLINDRSVQWKMVFNPDPTKPAEEVIFTNRPNITYPSTLAFIPIKRVNEHKHLGLTLDSKLSFISHVDEKIAKANRGIGFLRKARDYLPRKALLQINKAHIRYHIE